MAVESFPFPSKSAISDGSRSLVTWLDSGRGRIAIAITAGAVLFGGVGSLSMHMQMSSMSSASDKPATSPAMPMAPSATKPMPVKPAGVALPAPAKDEGPMRRGGAGTVVPSGPAAAPAPTSSSAASGSSANPSSSAPKGSTKTSQASSRRAASSSSPSTGASAQGGTSYTVRSGDDFGAVASRLGISQSRIAALNPGLDSTRLSIGQTIRVH